MTSRTEYCTQTPNKPSLFDVQYLRNHRTLDIGVLGYIDVVWPKEHSPEVRSFLLGHPVYIYTHIHIHIYIYTHTYIHTHTHVCVCFLFECKKRKHKRQCNERSSRRHKWFYVFLIFNNDKYTNTSWQHYKQLEVLTSRWTTYTCTFYIYDDDVYVRLHTAVLFGTWFSLKMT